MSSPAAKRCLFSKSSTVSAFTKRHAHVLTTPTQWPRPRDDHTPTWWPRPRDDHGHLKTRTSSSLLALWGVTLDTYSSLLQRHTSPSCLVLTQQPPILHRPLWVGVVINLSRTSLRGDITSKTSLWLLPVFSKISPFALLHPALFLFF